MKVIKGENQYALVVSKVELQYIAACVGRSNESWTESEIEIHYKSYGKSIIKGFKVQEMFDLLIKEFKK